MKAFLMYRDQDFDSKAPLPPQAEALSKDLSLNTLFEAMAQGDKYLFEAAGKTVLCSLTDAGVMLYRQDVLRDCLKNAAAVREIYDLAVETIESEKRNYFGIYSRYPAAILRRSIEVLQMFADMLEKLKKVALAQTRNFASEGFARFFSMIIEELDEDYMAEIRKHLRELKFGNGVLVSARLGEGNKGADYILLKHAPKEKRNWLKRIFPPKPPLHAFYISDRDESGLQALSELKDRGIDLIANALAQSNDHILSFFKLLRAELAFYIGCLNLHGKLMQKGESVCFPVPAALGERRHSFRGLYEACLALNLPQKAVGNTVNADDKDLVMITGANQGGKSTFLRSIGLAQLMMQCGMFVPAESFCANVCDGLFTHFKREEDTAMVSGKFDEELRRMSGIVDYLKPDSMVLFNESFAATNEKEGSEIARQITRALLEKRVKVFFVTHLYRFAHDFYNEQRENGIYLRAERQPGGLRTFRIIEGEPLQTSFGEDLYNNIFGKSSAHSAEGGN